MKIATPLVLILLCLLLLTAVSASSAGDFAGVGIDGVARTDGQIRVRQLVSGSPAHLAGIRVGDLLTHIDGRATRGSDFTTVVHRYLRGAAGSPVVLTIQRAGSLKPLTYTLIRRQLLVMP